MWAITQDTWQKTMVNKTDYREVPGCRNDLLFIHTVGLVTGFDDYVRSSKAEVKFQFLQQPDHSFRWIETFSDRPIVSLD